MRLLMAQSRSKFFDKDSPVTVHIIKPKYQYELRLQMKDFKYTPIAIFSTQSNMEDMPNIRDIIKKEVDEEELQRAVDHHMEVYDKKLQQNLKKLEQQKPTLDPTAYKLRKEILEDSRATFLKRTRRNRAAEIKKITLGTFIQACLHDRKKLPFWLDDKIPSLGPELSEVLLDEFRNKITEESIPLRAEKIIIRLNANLVKYSEAKKRTREMSKNFSIIRRRFIRRRLFTNSPH